MQAQSDAGLLGDRDHGAHEVLVVRPHRVVVEHAVDLVLRAPDEGVVLRLLATGDQEVVPALGIECDRMSTPVTIAPPRPSGPREVRQTWAGKKW